MLGPAQPPADFFVFQTRTVFFPGAAHVVFMELSRVAQAYLSWVFWGASGGPALCIVCMCTIDKIYPTSPEWAVMA